MLYRDGEHIPTYGDICNIAIDVLEKRGLNKGDFHSGYADTGSVCILGACNVASGGLPDYCALLKVSPLLTDLLRELTGTEDTIAQWNDREEIELEDVVHFLKLAKQRFRYDCITTGDLKYLGWKP